MPRLATFGFEAEYATNASGVIQHLHAGGYAGTDALHSYHCDCAYCEFHSGYAFRGQTDSSCSGEIISDVMATGEAFVFEDGEFEYAPTALMDRLCEAAVEVDAEPGLNSGFHVHVGIDGLGLNALRESLWQFIRWEPVLARIGGGRWQEQRSGMNSTVRQCTSHVFNDWHDADGWTETAIRNVDTDNDDHGEFLTQLLYAQQQADRHSNLNISARRAPTWEFRLWNSTRSAWRMEMFCGLSVALLDPDVVAALAHLNPPIRRRLPSSGVFDVAAAVAAGGHEAIAELVNRQATYLDERAAQAPSVLTLV